jgi:1-acyl-sn-glycerol-3-phosphate acyltransferase
MDHNKALVRLAREADPMPFAKRALHRARRAVDDAMSRTLGSDFEERTARMRARYESMGGDPFGRDPDFTKYVAMAGAVLHRLYFRSRVEGIEHVPTGRALFVSNHSGQIPLDAVMIAVSLFVDAEPPRIIRAMVEKWSQTLPFVSVLFTRTGQVVGVPENCRRLLEQGESILVFPEGVRGVNKPFVRRYQLEPFGFGFMRLAMETNTPIVPVAVVGAEEQYINVGNLEWAAKALGLPSFPVVPQWLIPGAQLPLPTRYHLSFGEPLRFEGDPDEDDLVVEQKVWLVKQTIQSMVNNGLKQRTSIFF